MQPDRGEPAPLSPRVCHSVAMAESPLHPLDLLLKSQQVAVRLAADTLRTVRDTAISGVTQPDELARQVGDLAGAVAGMATAVTGLAGSTAQPLQDFIVRQRELADTVATLAEAQSELAGIVAALAERHADAVNSLEKVTAPIFALVGTGHTAPKTRASRSKPTAATTPREKPTSS